MVQQCRVRRKSVTTLVDLDDVGVAVSDNPGDLFEARFGRGPALLMRPFKLESNGRVSGLAFCPRSPPQIHEQEPYCFLFVLLRLTRNIVMKDFRFIGNRNEVRSRHLFHANLTCR